jgi:hypothetical protein
VVAGLGLWQGRRCGRVGVVAELETLGKGWHKGCAEIYKEVWHRIARCVAGGWKSCCKGVARGVAGGWIGQGQRVIQGCHRKWCRM